jgi:hypothetical protein
MIEQRPGYTNTMMTEYCQSLLNVLSQTEKKTVGRGKAKVEVDVLKYKDAKSKLKEVMDSCEYYKRKKDSIELRTYQQEIAEKGVGVLKKHRFLYLAMEVRTGKTLTSLSIAEMVGAKSVLFLTKKKAIDSIKSDYDRLNASYKITIINYESVHHVDDNFDLIICDEAHSLGAFAKPSGRAQDVKAIIKKNNPLVVLLSGTPTPESYSQMYHQVYGIPNNPFKEFPNFYRFCDKYVKITEKRINGLIIRDYSNGSEEIINAMKPYTINYSQKEAGFLVETTEHILEVEMKPMTYKMIEKLKRDLVIEGAVETILADTSVKLMSKVHQLCSGTIKFESGNSMVIDTSKADFIKSHFDGKKIGIFYKFKEELEALKQVFGDDLTTELKEFESTDKNIALQIVSGREGISLKDAECLVYYNIDFSATSYWQSRDRMTTKDRLKNNIYWIFSKGGIEYDIYKAVIKKKDYTVKHFKNGLDKNSEED